MAIKTTRVTIGVDPTPLMPYVSTDVTPGQTLGVRNVGDVQVLVGGGDVTVENGWPLFPGEVWVYDANESDMLFGVRADDVGGVAVIAVLQAGV